MKEPCACILTVPPNMSMNLLSNYFLSIPSLDIRNKLIKFPYFTFSWLEGVGKAILRLWLKIKQLLELHAESTSLKLQKVVMDFEVAVWISVFSVRIFPRGQILGCGFHWSQALLIFFKDLGLPKEY